MWLILGYRVKNLVLAKLGGPVRWVAQSGVKYVKLNYKNKPHPESYLRHLR